MMSEFLKCDAAGCTHVETVGEITEAMIGKACPVCGASLLTAEDWEAWQRAFRPMIDGMKAAGLLHVDDVPLGDPQGIRINYHDRELHVRFPEPTDKITT